MKKAGRRKSKKTGKASNALSNEMNTYVMYGFCRSDPEDVGYLAKIPMSAMDEVIATELSNAQRFQLKPADLEKARTFINEEFKDFYGPHAYAFHPVKVLESLKER